MKITLLIGAMQKLSDDNQRLAKENNGLRRALKAMDNALTAIQTNQARKLAYGTSTPEQARVIGENITKIIAKAHDQVSKYGP